MKNVISQNYTTLGQAEILLQTLDNKLYSRPEKAVFHGSIGDHLRHVLDHYHCFFKAYQNGLVDYCMRERQAAIENDQQLALAEIKKIRKQLISLQAQKDTPDLRIKPDLDGAAVPTSVQRELEFLLSHTTHHFAIIAIIASLQGLHLDPEFGIAPSTLRYQQGQSGQCVH